MYDILVPFWGFELSEKITDHQPVKRGGDVLCHISRLRLIRI